MKDEELEYALLLKRTQAGEDTFIFTPVNLLKGITIEDDNLKMKSFTDNTSKEYQLYNSFEAMYDVSEYYVKPLMNVKALKEKYPKELIENAEMYLFDQYNNIVYVLYCNPNFETMVNEDDILELDLNDLYNKQYLKAINESVEYDIQRERERIEQENRRNLQQQEIKSAFEEKKDFKRKFDVNKFYQQTTSRVIGQNDAVKEVATALYMDQFAKTTSDRNRCLLIGSTGVGKTEIVRCVSDYLNIPMVLCDSTQLTAPGYVGANIEDFLERLVRKADNDIEKAEHGIFVFNEIDKKGSDDNGDVSHRAVLNTLLPFIDGTDYELSLNGKHGKTTTFNTSNLTIFADGAFTNVINKKCSLQKNNIGFNPKNETTQEKIEIEPEDLIKYGLIPDELIGRFSNIIRLNDHTVESLSSILLNSNISQLRLLRNKFKKMGVELTWEDKFIEAVAKKAIERKLGGRALKSIIDESAKIATWKIITNEGKYKNLELLEETVENPKCYRLK